MLRVFKLTQTIHSTQLLTHLAPSSSLNQNILLCTLTCILEFIKNIGTSVCENYVESHQLVCWSSVNQSIRSYHLKVSSEGEGRDMSTCSSYTGLLTQANVGSFKHSFVLVKLKSSSFSSLYETVSPGGKSRIKHFSLSTLLWLMLWKSSGKSSIK